MTNIVNVILLYLWILKGLKANFVISQKNDKTILTTMLAL